jgi:hypothetical protein
MKTETTFFARALRVAALGLGLSCMTTTANAQFSRMWGRQSSDSDRHESEWTRESSRYSHSDRRDSYAMRRYHSHPRSSFTLSFGTGYAGRGYYLGPPGAGYYYQRPGVVFYRSLDAVPYSYRRHLGVHSGGGVSGYALQRALARMGYYRGPIDGDIGPGTRRAIMRFEQRNGMPVTGEVSGRLLRALNL